MVDREVGPLPYLVREGRQDARGMVTVDQLPTTMRAIRQRGYGDAGVWGLGEEPVPTPGPGRVLVRVEAAGVDQGTWHLLTGKPYLLRLVFGLRAPKRVVPGLDLAGRVVAIGEGVAPDRRRRRGVRDRGGVVRGVRHRPGVQARAATRLLDGDAGGGRAGVGSDRLAGAAHGGPRGGRAAGAGDRSVRRGRQLRRADRRRRRSAGDRGLQRGQGRLSSARWGPSG